MKYDCTQIENVLNKDCFFPFEKNLNHTQQLGIFALLQWHTQRDQNLISYVDDEYHQARLGVGLQNSRNILVEILAIRDIFFSCVYLSFDACFQDVHIWFLRPAESVSWN